MNKLYQILKSIEDDKFYGELTVKFEAGKVAIIKKTESIKP